MEKKLAKIDATLAKRLGAVLKAKREEQGLSAYAIAKQTGLSRTYVSYVEQGKFVEMGLDKFVRILRALEISADEVLQEAGYLSKTDRDRPELKKALKQTYELSDARLTQVLEYAEFLADRNPNPHRRKKK